ncbi:MAG: 16S rRNA (uracil(1498)-N(3))-methyltransferase [Phycisphaerales bacterium]|nr:16S rRNA (uracil(1498)-N(3))-methyltransferase [Phycisphaerales bacterium]
MRRHRVYMPDLQPGRHALPAAEADHLRRVLRSKPGDAVTLFDGAGGEADAVVEALSREGVRVAVGQIVSRPFECLIRVTLATALPRGPRQSTLIEKCTELGVWAIWPLVCERSVVRAGDGSVAKWQRTVIEACKQCGRAWATRVERPRPFDEVIATAGEFDLVMMADVCEEAVAIADLTEGRPPPRSALMLIGPEGGWSAGETEVAGRIGAITVRLGPHVMRIETAAIAAIALLIGGR